MKSFVCIVCPNGCRLQAEEKDGTIIVTGNKCKKGEEFARTELTDPVRTLTTTVRTVFPGMPVLPVRTVREIPLATFPAVIAELARVTVTVPASAGEVVLKNAAGAGSDVIACSDCP